MDDIVRQAMAKWPNVPDCYGWLGLDARGQWCLRDEATQAAGAFPQSKGAVLQHAGLIAFIGRNYARDPEGRWFFQNGPQRVFVELELAPWVWRLQPDGRCLSHTGHAVEVQAVWVDETGVAYLETDWGLGSVHPQDMHELMDRIEQQQWPMHDEGITRERLATRFGFVHSPQQTMSEDRKD